MTLNYSLHQGGVERSSPTVGGQNLNFSSLAWVGGCGGKIPQFARANQIPRVMLQFQKQGVTAIVKLSRTARKISTRYRKSSVSPR
jgi:hypothetical protein